MSLQNFFIVLLGSGLGGGCRYLVAYFYSLHNDGSRFFLPTLTVNTIGSLLIGFVFALVSKNMIGEKGNLLIVTGFMGGFTTFSTFSLDELRLIQQEEIMTSILYGFGSLFLGLLFVFIGYSLGHKL